MTAVVYPTVTLGVAGFGGRVVQRMQDALDRDEPMLRSVSCDAAEVGTQLHASLDTLLRAGTLGTTQLTEPRLDLMAFMLGLHGDPGDIVGVCDQAARVVGERYGALFPANRPPEQRTAVLHLVVVVPPMTASSFGDVLGRLQALERWAADSPPYPLLSRVWLLSIHSRAGVLSAEDAERSCAAFGVAMLGSGAREDDAVGHRLAPHRHGEGLFSFLSAASLTLPRERLRRYASTRAVYDGLSTLVTRVEQEADPTIALGAVNSLRHENWVEPFADGEAAQRCRQMSAGLAGATGGIPDRPKARPFDEPDNIRARYPVLFRPATQVREASQTDIGNLNSMIEGLDKAESAALAEIEGGIERVFHGKLGQATGLQELPVVYKGLSQVRDALMDSDREDTAILRGDEGPADEQDPLREELEEALEALPSRRMLFAVASTLGATLTGLCLVLGLGLAGELMNWVAETYPTSDWAHPAWRGRLAVLVWLLALAAGPLFAGVVARVLGARTRRGATWALQQRADAVTDLWRRGGGGEPGRQAESQLRQRRLRVRRGAIVALQRAREHLEATRRTLIGSRDAARQRMRDMGVTARADAALDDLSNLLGETHPLHQPLLPMAAVGRWVRSCREMADPEVWSNRLLESSWPADGLLVDVPCGDEAQLEELGREQTRPLATRNLFQEPFAADAAASTVATFATNAPLALSEPTTPQDVHGDPVRGLRPGEMIAVAPIAGRSKLEPALESCPVDLPVLWTDSRVERVIFLRTWEGFELAQLARGMGFGR